MEALAQEERSLVQTAAAAEQKKYHHRSKEASEPPPAPSPPQQQQPQPQQLLTATATQRQSTSSSSSPSTANLLKTRIQYLERSLADVERQNDQWKHQLAQLQSVMDTTADTTADTAATATTDTTDTDLLLAVLQFFYRKNEQGYREVVHALEKALRILPGTEMHAKTEHTLKGHMDKRDFKEAIQYVK